MLGSSMKQLLSFLLLFFTLKPLDAHPLNTSNIELYLNKPQPTLSLRFYIFNLKPLLMLKDDPTAITVTNSKSEILNYIQKSIQIKNRTETCNLTPLLFHIEDEIALQTEFLIVCKEPIEQLSILYSLFFEFDKTQEGVMQILTYDDEKLFVFSPHQKEYHLQLNAAQEKLDFQNFIIEGVWHIWRGIDHILFLVMLLLPSVLFKHNFKETLIDVIKIVTAFTLSHSLTLSLSMFHIFTPPQQLIETLIALSVLFVALNNIYPFISLRKEWLVAFTFGFIHGFGFANAMQEMHLTTIHFTTAVFGFNIGVEIGQIIIVLLLLPLLYHLSFKIVYRTFLLPTLSLFVALTALFWAIERAFELQLLPF